MGHLQCYLHVYDVTNTTSPGTNTTIERLNNITRQINLGGVFHGAIELQGSQKFAGREYSFGYCERGTGVYACNSKANPMYTFRETIDLGVSERADDEVREILQRLSQQWQGSTYDLLSRNCCHFCEELASYLGVKPVPGWLNRFAAGADATVAFTNEAITMMRHVGSEISKTATSASSWMRDAWSRTVVAQQQGQQQQQQGGDMSPRRSGWGKLMSADLFNRSSDAHGGVTTINGAAVVFTQQPVEQRMSKNSIPAVGPLGDGAAGGGAGGEGLLRAFSNGSPAGDMHSHGHGTDIGHVPSATIPLTSGFVTSPRHDSFSNLAPRPQQQQQQESLI